MDQLVWHSESIKVLVPGGNFGVEYLAEPDVSFAVDMFSIDKPIA